MSHNRQLDELLSQARETAAAARCEEDFLPLFSRLREFRRKVGPIMYDNSAKWYAFAAIAVVGGVFAVVFFLNADLQRTLDVWGYGVIGAFVIALAVMLMIIGTANAAIGEISDLIFEKDVAFDNLLVEVRIGDKGGDLYDEYRAAFGEFRSRGDEGRRITRLVRGQWSEVSERLRYDYYVFRYVRVYYVPVMKKIGKTTITTMERRTETLYRYGIMLDFPYAKGIAVVSGGGSYDRPERFETASEEFNRAFSVGADSAQAAAKFLKPAVVLEFLDMCRVFSGLNVEIDDRGRMNIAFSDSGVLDRTRSHSIAEPDAFEKEVLTQLELPKLRRLREFVRALMKHNDSNF